MIKQYPIIYTNDNILLVDKASHKGKYFLFQRQEVQREDHVDTTMFQDFPLYYEEIIASTVKIGDLPQFRIEEEITYESLTKKFGEPRDNKFWFEQGYKAAQAKKYTEEDLLNFGQFLYRIPSEKFEEWAHHGNTATLLKEFLQSLQPKYKAAEVEMEHSSDENDIIYSGGDYSVRPLVKDGFITIKRFIV